MLSTQLVVPLTGDFVFLNQRLLVFMYLVISMDFPIRSMRTWLSKRLPPHSPVVTLSPYPLGLSHLSGCIFTTALAAPLLHETVPSSLHIFFLELILE